eukprot:TRINITY_DN10701_c0_g1_i1.p1 TRINITY_DN10701_c0_g1~~TRINITY_DN10701_c0_g1_i1.p1  ORF type:complete len:512 (+),score=131.13 TRINITY_DN10701_c0_g1_i1:120-1538(+)
MPPQRPRESSGRGSAAAAAAAALLLAAAATLYTQTRARRRRRPPKDAAAGAGPQQQLPPAAPAPPPPQLPAPEPPAAPVNPPPAAAAPPGGLAVAVIRGVMQRNATLSEVSAAYAAPHAPAPTGEGACYEPSPLERRWMDSIFQWQFSLSVAPSQPPGPLMCKQPVQLRASRVRGRRAAPARGRRQIEQCFWGPACAEVIRDQVRLRRSAEVASALRHASAQAAAGDAARAAAADSFCRVRRSAADPWGWVEPLTSFLRDPREFCLQQGLTFARDWLVLADASLLGGRQLALFDAGAGPRLIGFPGMAPANNTQWFLDRYAERGCDVAEIHAWEPGFYGTKESWTTGVPAAVRAKVRFSSKPIECCGRASSEEADLLGAMRAAKARGRYVVLKLDTDSPVLEESVVGALLREPHLADELFWEHHVQYSPMVRWWVSGSPASEANYISNLTVSGSYELFTQLRRRGVRAHSWV